MDEATRNELTRLIAKVASGQPVKQRVRQRKAQTGSYADWNREYRRRPFKALGIEGRKTGTKLSFTYDRERVLKVAEPRMHAIPMFDGRVLVRAVLRQPQMAAALGVGLGTIDRWVKVGLFPRPLGHYLLRFKKVPAYTVQEALTYLHLLATETGGAESNRPFAHYPQLQGILAAARERLLADMTRKGERAPWTTAIKPVPNAHRDIPSSLSSEDEPSSP